MCRRFDPGLGHQITRASGFIFFLRQTPLRVQTKSAILSAVFTTPSASLTQLVECHLAKVVVDGSSPLARSIQVREGDVNGSLAQLVEQVTLNHWVVGSNPSTPTISIVRAASSGFSFFSSAGDRGFSPADVRLNRKLTKI